ncbi:MAG: ATP phosphoribosyltransferase regulatory subunit [Candidatus Doudnabacteria bacterium]
MPKTATKKTSSVKPKVKVKSALQSSATKNSPHWNSILKRLQKIGRAYGFVRIETPIVEEEKTYSHFYKDQPSFLDRTVFTKLGSKSVALRSAVLPSVLRYYVQHKIFDEQTLSKWFYVGNVIYLDDKQSTKSNYEFGFEVLGGFNHLTEAQVISAVWEFLNLLGLQDLQIEVNTLGGTKTQTNYQNVLKEYCKTRDFDLCDNCLNQINKRPLDILRCDQLGCQVVVSEAPPILDYLTDDVQKHFTDVLEALDELEIPYQLNHHYAGPQGATKTNFVVRYVGGKKPIVLGEGSWHENLLSNLTGKPLPAFGFVGNLAALTEAMEVAKVETEKDYNSEVFLVPLGELASKRSLKLFRDLVVANIRVHDHFGTEGVKNQLKAAQEYNAPIALIMGQKEAAEEQVILRDVKSGMQEIFSYDKIIDEVKKRLGR